MNPIHADTAIYIRVSTEEQNLESQQNEIGNWLKHNHVAAERVEWFEDKASGKDIGHRPGFMRLEQAVMSGRIKTVIVWKIDRLSRNLFDGLSILGKWCERGVRFVSITQNIDMSGTMGHIVAALLLGIAQIERENIQERAAAGIKIAKAKGKFRGRPRGKRDHKTRPKIPAILRLFRNGVTSPYTISRTVGGIHPETVKAILRERKLIPDEQPKGTTEEEPAEPTDQEPTEPSPSSASYADEPVAPVNAVLLRSQPVPE